MSKIYPKTYPKTYAKVYGKVNPPVFSTTYANYPFLTDLVDTSSYGNVATYSRASGATQLTSTAMLDLATDIPSYPGFGIEIEPEHTNTQKWSRKPANAIYSKSNCTATDDFATSLRGDLTAGKITASNTSPYVHAQALTDTSSGTFTASRFVKIGTAAVGHVQFFLYGTGSTNGTGAWFNMNTGAVGTTFQDAAFTLTDTGMDDYGGGWYRIWFTATGTVTSLFAYTRFTRVNGSHSAIAGDYGIVDQIDVQKQAYLLSPVHSTTTAATAAKGVLTIPSSHFPVNDFTITVDWKPSGINSFNYIVSTGADSNNNMSTYYNNGNARYETFNYYGGLQRQSVVSSVVAAVGVVNTATITNSSSTGLTLDVDATSNTDATLYNATLNATANIGSRYDSSNQVSGQIANVTVVSL